MMFDNRRTDRKETIMKRILTTTLALGLTGTAGFAGSLADPVPTPVTTAPAPYVAPSTDWTGFYGGINLGRIDVDGTGGADGDDTSYGLHAGYDYDFGSYVLGGEVEYDKTDIDLNGAATVDNVARLKLKAGYDLGSTLIYATAGAARVDTSLGNDTGAFGGLGVAYQLTDQFTLGSEVLYHDFSDIGGSGVDANATTLGLRASFRF
jgi:predicted porin